MMHEPHLQHKGNNPDDEGIIIEHETADLMRVLYKLGLADAFGVTNVYERMWDADEMREVNDLIGYKVHWTE